MTNPSESHPFPSGDQDHTSEPSSADLDRSALNALTIRALEPQVYFGKGLELSAEDRAQLGLVVTLAEKTLEPAYQDPEWQAFQKLVREGDAKGVLISFTTHKGTNVPTWCIDGGEEAAVKKVRADGDRPAIEVPSKVYNLFHWDRTVEAVRSIASTSDETLRGTSTKPLGEGLQHLAHLIGKPEGDHQSEVGL